MYTSQATPPLHTKRINLTRMSAAWLVVIMAAMAVMPVGGVHAEGYWFKRAEMPTPRQEVQPVALNGKIYLVGGYLPNYTISNKVEVYDPAAGTWDTAASLPYACHHYASAVVDGILYVFGGYTSSSLPWTVTDYVMAYDPSTDEWTPETIAPSRRGEHVATVYAGKIYLLGGNNDVGDDLATVEVYDPGAGTWATVTPMPTARHHLAAVVLDTLIYAVGGRFGYWGELTGGSGALEAYSPSSDQWYVLEDMPTPRGALSAAVLGGDIYTFGGEYPDVFDEVEAYEPVSDSWRSLDPMMLRRHGTGGVTIGDTIFVIGGSTLFGIGTTGANHGFTPGVCSDADQDGYGDIDHPENTCPSDNCPSLFNPDQADMDADGVGDLCDNCVSVANPGQEDVNQNDIGDACEPCCGLYTGGFTGNTDCDTDGKRNLADITKLIDRVYLSKIPLCCEPDGNVDGDPDGKLNLSDITALIDHVYLSKNQTRACP